MTAEWRADASSAGVLTWVVGAGGLLGHNVQQSLVNRGCMHSSPTIEWSDATRARRSLQAGAAALLAAAGANPWQLLWCAGAGVTGTAREVLDVELEMLSSTLRALAPGAFGGAVFLASSAGGVYAGSPCGPYDEWSPPRPLAQYGWAKLHAERLVSDWAADTGGLVLIGRIANLYGPGQNLAKPQGLVSQLCSAHLDRRPSPIWVSLDTLRDYLYAPDCAELILDAMDRLRTEAGERSTRTGLIVTKVLATQRAITVGAVLGEMRRIFRSRPPIALGASPTSSMQARDLSLVSRVWPDLDHRPFTTFPAGAAATLADLRLRRQLGEQRPRHR